MQIWGMKMLAEHARKTSHLPASLRAITAIRISKIHDYDRVT